jgi:NAD+ synthase
MVDRFKLALAQLNPIVGDVSGNAERVRRARAAAATDGADLVVFSELFISGYPPEDLVLKPAFQAACRSAVEQLARETSDGGPSLAVGTPWLEDGKLYNAVVLLDGGRIAGVRLKVDLPNYGVFDEKRVFAVGPMPGPVSFRGVRLGLPICEDIWGPEPVECIAETGGEILLVANGSPYRRGVIDVRLNVWCRASGNPACRCFTSTRSAARTSWCSTAPRSRSTPTAALAVQLPAFETAVVTTHWQRKDGGWLG